MKQFIKLSQWQVSAEYLPRTSQMVYKGIQLLMVFLLFHFPDCLHFFFGFCYQFLQHDGFIAVG